MGWHADHASGKYQADFDFTDVRTMNFGLVRSPDSSLDEKDQ